jgi:hypothetical protein
MIAVHQTDVFDFGAGFDGSRGALYWEVLTVIILKNGREPVGRLNFQLK